MIYYPQFNSIWCSNKAEKYKMSYMAMGNPLSSKILVCVHGLNRNNRDWDFIATQAVKSGYYVICPDIVGRGNSDYLVDYNNYQIPNYIEDIKNLIVQLSLTNVDYVGTSLGGIIGMSIAAHYPRLLRSLVLNDIGAQIEITGLQRIASYSAVAQEFDTFNEAKAGLISTSREFGYAMSDELWSYISLNSYQKNNVGKWVLRRDANIAKALVTSYSDANSLRDFATWGKVITPTMVIRGEKSDILSQETVEKMKLSQPGLKLIEYPDCGHAPFLYTDSHWRDLLDFFTQVSK